MIEDVIKKTAATWLLKTKELRKLPQSTIDSIVTDVTEFFKTVHDEMYPYALKKIEEGVDVHGLLSDLFSSSSVFASPFKGLESAYLQHQYYKKNFNMIVSSPLC